MNGMNPNDFENIAKMMNSEGGMSSMKAEAQAKNQAITPANIKAYDIYKVDYDWVDQCLDKKELKLAHAALKADGYFKDLWKHVEKRIKVLEPAYKTEEEKQYVDPVAKTAADDDVMSFFKSAGHQDDKLRGKTAGEH
jgi:hypothetical protein